MLSRANSWFHVASTELDRDLLHKLVNSYSTLIESISKQRDQKSSKFKEDLASLDKYRYEHLPNLLAARRDSSNGKDKSYGYLELEELQRLLEWKMSRGVFRPSLRGLIASNSPHAVKTITSDVFAEFASLASDSSKDLNASIQQSLKALCKLRGVGPATASLILSIAYPSEVAFFADELFAWIALKDKKMLDTFLQQKHPNGTGEEFEGKRVDKIMGIKYSDAEYKSLCTAVSVLIKQLGEDISATNVEKAAFVVLQGLEVSWTAPEPSAQDSSQTGKTGNLSYGKKQSKMEDSGSRQHDRHSPSNLQELNQPSQSKSKRRSERLQTKDESSSKQASKRRKVLPT